MSAFSNNLVVVSFEPGQRAVWLPYEPRVPGTLKAYKLGKDGKRKYYRRILAVLSSGEIPDVEGYAPCTSTLVVLEKRVRDGEKVLVQYKYDYSSIG